ncbi:hypothetical protein L227DRAFT_258989 [Lentinus tigrinus ALCF2SS1-6]|uniref:Uncharacterized protein n=1 Tax=Lentinus tigrinus ALCF2SS1-6 TaxID=1328759 RepID=A0A5C2RZH8_9APHY|nr:hypothetical protein L227DRAFT_258989 [Lentinus tigrinus ALCF2SS1-6]
MEARDITNTLSDSRVASSSRTDTPLEASQPPLPAEPHATAAYSYYPTGVSAQQLDSPARAINFSNALNYLDSVKAQFSQQPEVYNKFLDIMKDANNSRRVLLIVYPDSIAARFGIQGTKQRN